MRGRAATYERNELPSLTERMEGCQCQVRQERRKDRRYEGGGRIKYVRQEGWKEGTATLGLYWEGVSTYDGKEIACKYDWGKQPTITT